jgi:pimeloyl-ACP methyl ester carboxylesterase
VNATDLGPAIDGKRRGWQPARSGVGRVCVYVAERRSGRPVVLLHDLGATSSAYEMRPLFESFRWRRPTFAIDLPGFGLSDRADLPYAPALFAAVLEELLLRLRRVDDSADVVALGRGSEVAVRVARGEPRLVRSLVMLEPSGLLPTRGGALHAASARLGQLLGDRVGRALFAVLSTRSAVRRSVGARFVRAPDEGLVAYAHASAQAAGAHFAPFAAAVNGPGPCADLSIYHGLTVPVLVVHDAPGANAAPLAAFLRGRANRFAVRVSPTRGMPHFERRQDTVAAVDRFWQSLSQTTCDRANW